jgi:peptidyl-prolyl cis-trans isomerase D
VSVAWVALDPAAPAKPLEVVPGDVEEFQRREAERIAAYYQENQARYELPERLRLRHVLVSFGGDEEAARVRAEAALERVEGGEDMAEVAREVSDDPGSRDLGGDLGLLPAGEIASALRDAVAPLSPGQLAPLVRGDQGFHVVRLEERLPAETRSLADVTPAIAEELYRAEQAEQWASRTAEDLAARIAEGKSLEEAARELELPIERSDFFRRRPDGFVPQLGDSQEVQTAAFALSPEAPTWPKPIQVGERTVFIQLLERREPAEEGLEARVEAEQKRLHELAQQSAEQIWLAERRTLLQAEGRIRIDPTALDAQAE